MNVNNDNVLHSDACHCLSWQPIIAGALIAIGLSFLLNLFSVAIGLTAFTTDNSGVETLAFGGLLGTCIGIVASMFAAGWMSGYLGKRHCAKAHLGALYGFLAWCVALIISIFLASYAQQYISFYVQFISGAASTVQVSSSAGQGVAATSNVSEKALIISTYIVFVLFFLSAFSASIGGHCGMRYRCKEICR